MKNTSLALFGVNSRKHNIKRILAEAQVMNIDTLFCPYRDIDISFGQDLKILIRGEQVNFEPDIVILDFPGPYLPIRNILTTHFSKENIFVLNGSSLTKWSSMNKLSQTYELQKSGIATVPTEYFGDNKRLTKATNNYPSIVKSIYGSHGSEVFKLASNDEWFDILSIYNSEDLLIQPFIKNYEEFRVIVIGDDAVGAVRKKPASGDFRANRAKGAIFKTVPITDVIREISVKSCRILGCDFGGVDIFSDERNTPMVIEVNRYLEFKGFEEETGMNISYMLLNWILKKTQNK